MNSEKAEDNWRNDIAVLTYKKKLLQFRVLDSLLHKLE